MGISGSGTMSYFFPTLMLSLGYSGTMANYMTAPVYAVALVASVLLPNSPRTTSQAAASRSSSSHSCGSNFRTTATEVSDERGLNLQDGRS